MNVRLPSRGPEVVGENVTATEQTAPVPRLVEKVHVPPGAREKSPLTTIFETLKVADPALLRVTVWELVVAPTSVDPKLRLAGKAMAEAGGPVPATATVTGVAGWSKISVIDIRT